MPTEPQPVTLFQVVHRAATVVDPDGVDADVTDFLTRYEDADEPVTAVVDIEQRLAEAAGALDPQQESGPLQVAVAGRHLPRAPARRVARRPRRDRPPGRAGGVRRPAPGAGGG